MLTRGRGRDQRDDDGPGRAAAASFGKTRRPEPAGLALGCLSGSRGLMPREPHRYSPSLRFRICAVRQLTLLTATGPGGPAGRHSGSSNEGAGDSRYCGVDRPVHGTQLTAGAIPPCRRRILVVSVACGPGELATARVEACRAAGMPRYLLKACTARGSAESPVRYPGNPGRGHRRSRSR
jgi:hypothetical protein